jgi:hypothetical protein
VAPATPASFSVALASILELSRQVADDDETGTAMSVQLKQLPEGWQHQLGTLLTLGRNVHDWSRFKTTTPPEGGAAPLSVLALCDKHTRSQQYLERALAMMCAQRLSIERVASSNDEVGGGESVFERAWSRFGRELASSDPSEWTWFGHRTQGTKELEKVYLRRGEGAWWSFSVGLDRPVRSDAGLKRRRTSRGRGAGLQAGLESLATHECAKRRALQRAMRSVRARLGIISTQKTTAPA